VSLLPRAPVAQVVEQAPFKRLVEGSSPSGRTQETARELAVSLFLVPVSLTLFRFVPTLSPHHSPNVEMLSQKDRLEK
jgi:hypothetical protein